MHGKVVVLTGGTSGIGQIAAQKLAFMGARIVLVARDKGRGEAMLARLSVSGTGMKHGVYFADLSRLAEMKRVAQAIAAAEPRIDVLINNAGALFDRRHVTADGLEMTFALNHLSYFVLTQQLGEQLLAAAPSRVVNISSEAHRRMKLDFDDLQSEKRYSAFRAYGRSKLCNILFTRELSRRLLPSGVTANCLHPGFVNTRFGDQAKGLLGYAFRLAKNFAISPEKGAETIIYLASSDDVQNITGQYFYQCRVKTPSNEAQDDGAAVRLWQESARLAKMNELRR